MKAAIPNDVAFRLAAKLLRLAADRFSNHSCNDFNLQEHGFTPEECLIISTAVWDEDDEQEPSDAGWEADWVLMYGAADALDPE